MVDDVALKVERSFWRILWDDAPLANFILYAVAIAYAEIANLDSPRPDLFFSCLFPLLVPVAVYALRWGGASLCERRVSIVVVGRAGRLPRPHLRGVAARADRGRNA
jgi:hypothetical protein